MTSKIIVNQIEGDVGVSSVTFNDTIYGSVEGNVTGNVTGNVEGDITVGTGATISGSTDTIIASTGGAERVRVTAGGSVGIGTDNPTRKLDVEIQTASGAVGGVKSSHPIAEFINISAGAARGLEIGASADSVTAPVYLKVSGTGNRFAILDQSSQENFTILDNGYVGIGSEIPGTNLDVLGGIRASATTNFLGGLRIANFTGYTQGFSSFDIDVTAADQQTSFFVIAGFNHYGLYSYGCSTVRHCATGPNFTEEIIQDQTTTLGGSWTASKVSSNTLRITKNAGTYNGGGFYLVSVYAAK